jgi:nitronate monooxygenase
VATRESPAGDVYKSARVDRDSDSTVVTDAFTGLYARVLRNTFTEEYAASGAPVLPAAYVQSRMARDIFDAARARKDREYLPLYAGQGVGMVKDLPAAADVVRAVVEEARAVLGSLSRDIHMD